MIGSPPDASAKPYSSLVTSGGRQPDGVKPQAEQSHISTQEAAASQVGNDNSHDDAGNAQGLAQQKNQRLRNPIVPSHSDSSPLIDQAQRNGTKREIETADPVYPLLGGDAPFNVGAVLVARKKSNRLGKGGSLTTNPHDTADNINNDGMVVDEMALQVIGREKIGLASCGHTANLQGNCVECEKLRLFWSEDNNDHMNDFEAVPAQETIEQSSPAKVGKLSIPIL